jgi:hypothetical protein
MDVVPNFFCQTRLLSRRLGCEIDPEEAAETKTDYQARLQKIIHTIVVPTTTIEPTCIPGTRYKDIVFIR